MITKLISGVKLTENSHARNALISLSWMSLFYVCSFFYVVSFLKPDLELQSNYPFFYYSNPEQQRAVKSHFYRKLLVAIEYRWLSKAVFIGETKTSTLNRITLALDALYTIILETRN